MRRGFTLLEMLLALAVMSLTLATAVPRLSAIRDAWITEDAAQAIIQAHRKARLYAVLLSRPVVLTVAPDTLRITTRADSVVWQGPGPAVAGAALAGPVRTLTFAPIGITMGLSNATFRISRGAALRTVIVSRLGRVRLQRGS